MSLNLKYTIFVLCVSVPAIAVGIWLLISAYGQGSVEGKSKDLKLALGNILIAVFTALLSAFAVEFFKPEEPDKDHGSNLPALASSSQCLDRWYLLTDTWHYSLTRDGGSNTWQVGRPQFSRQASDRIIGHGVWLNTADNSRVTSFIEAGCRGQRGILIFTENGASPDSIPTVEIYPELPDNQQAPVVGYAIDRTWDDHEALAPVLISHQPLHGSQEIGPIKDTAVNNRLLKTWRDLYAHTARAHECMVCTTLTSVP
jgi:hypothetical protein